MQRVLASLLLLLAPALSSPLPVDTPQKPVCASQSGTFTGWDLSNYMFTANLQTSLTTKTGHAEVSFDLKSPVSGIFRCTARSSDAPNFFVESQEHDCVGTDVAYNSRARFAYNHATSFIKVWQTWICRDEPEFPATFFTNGNVTVERRCASSTVGDIGASVVTCKSDTQKIPLYEISAIA